MQAGERIEIIEVVELRRGPQRAEQQPADVRAALDERPAGIGPRHVAADRQVAEQLLRGLEASGRALPVVVGPHQIAPVVHVLAGNVEQSLVIPAGHGQVVVRDESGGEQLIEVIVPRYAVRQYRTPAARRQPAPPRGTCRRLTSRACRRTATAPLPVLGLQRNAVGGVVHQQLASERRARRARCAALGGDQHDALAGSRPVDGGGRCSLQDLDRGNVAGVDVCATIRRDRPGDVVPRAAGHRGGVVDRNTVDDDQRLAATVDRTGPADADERRGARVARLRDDFNVGHLPRERFDDVHLVAALDQRGVHVATNDSELLDLRDRSRAGDDDLAEL